ncbi:hypothetical protein ABZ671_13510 [Micromonospora sp. NPDC006766]|uniref:hypothetical protein n=1 Tax=Micromonospora sp. NPDC006766 TaxID=3154778 RepID=UPI0033F1521A
MRWAGTTAPRAAPPARLAAPDRAAGVRVVAARRWATSAATARFPAPDCNRCTAARLSGRASGSRTPVVGSGSTVARGGGVGAARPGGLPRSSAGAFTEKRP